MTRALRLPIDRRALRATWIATASHVRGAGRRLEGMLWPSTAWAVTAGMLLDGFDGGVGQASACLVGAGLLTVLILARPPRIWLWQALGPILALAGVALLWSGLGLLLPITTWVGESVPFAPDLFAASAASYLAGLAALVAGAIVGTDRDGRSTVLDWIIGIGVAYLLAGLLMLQVGPRDEFAYWSLQNDGRFTGMIGNANVTAAAAGALALLSLAKLLSAAETWSGWQRDRGRTIRVAAYGLAFAAAFGAELATASRFAVLVTLLLATAMLLVFLFHAHGRLSRLTRLRWPLVALMVVVGAIYWHGGGLLENRFGTLAAEGTNRSTMWAQYCSIALGSPLFGYGLGSFPSVNAHFLPDAHFAAGFWNVNSPHAILLQLLLAGGIPYFVLLLSAAYLVAARVVGDVRRRVTIEGIGPPAAAVVIVLCGNIDIALDMAVTTVLMLFLAGVSFGTAVARSAGGSRAEPVQHESAVGGRVARKVEDAGTRLGVQHR